MIRSASDGMKENQMLDACVAGKVAREARVKMMR